MIEIDKSLGSRKEVLLSHFREIAGQAAENIGLWSASLKQKSTAANQTMKTVREQTIREILGKAGEENWSNEEILECLLMTTYTNYVAMIELRNDLWPYEYMSFSRRIGELWEPFCRLCFDYPPLELERIEPLSFSDVRGHLTQDIETLLDSLNISSEEKGELRGYYDLLWGLLTAGDIKLKLDLHFRQNGVNCHVDFKSGFGSNEKGNTNRLLVVATIYKNVDAGCVCLLLVRAEEDRNNNYFRTLKNSGVWEASCGSETYQKIKAYSGYDIQAWIDTNMDWCSDFDPGTYEFICQAELDQYLLW